MCNLVNISAYLHILVCLGRSTPSGTVIVKFGYICIYIYEITN